MHALSSRTKAGHPIRSTVRLILYNPLNRRNKISNFEIGRSGKDLFSLLAAGSEEAIYDPLSRNIYSNYLVLLGKALLILSLIIIIITLIRTHFNAINSAATTCCVTSIYLIN